MVDGKLLWQTIRYRATKALASLRKYGLWGHSSRSWDQLAATDLLLFVKLGTPSDDCDSSGVHLAVTHVMTVC